MSTHSVPGANQRFCVFGVCKKQVCFVLPDTCQDLANQIFWWSRYRAIMPRGPCPPQVLSPAVAEFMAGVLDPLFPSGFVFWFTCFDKGLPQGWTCSRATVTPAELWRVCPWLSQQAWVDLKSGGGRIPSLFSVPRRDAPGSQPCPCLLASPGLSLA